MNPDSFTTYRWGNPTSPVKVQCDLCRSWRSDLLDLGFCYECWQAMTPDRLTALFDYVIADRPASSENWQRAVRRELVSIGWWGIATAWATSKLRRIAAWWKVSMP